MKRLKYVSFIIVLCLAISTFVGASSVFADEESESDINYGHVPVDEIFNGYEEGELDMSQAPLAATYTDSVYQYFGAVKNKYPWTRNQNPYGTCWAFAATACAEFDLVNQGAYDKSLDLSERQLIWYHFNTANDRLGNLDGDKVSCVSSDGFPAGSNVLFAQNTLANWKGYTNESTLPYSAVTTAPSSSMVYKSNAAKLVNSRMLDTRDQYSIKKEIIDHGAVAVSYRHDSNYYALSNGFSTYYYPYNTSNTNHAVVIVGWDDNFAASNFPAGNRPSSNGAWLVRNSWSSTITSGSEYTYFYMSYEDGSLANDAYSLDFEVGSKYSNIYQYDGSPYHTSTTAYKVANVFTAKNPDNYMSERLTAVMIPFTYQANVNYKIEIYTGLRDSSNPESGYLNHTATTYGSTTYKGIYTVNLNSGVILAPGETYSIVVTATSGSAYFDKESSLSGTDFLATTASSDAGESFYMYREGSSWTDQGSYGSGNFCVKGITTNSSNKKYVITYNLNGGSITSSAKNGYFSTDPAFNLETPTKDGYHFLGWYTNSSFSGSKVTSVSGSTASNLTLYAKWEAHSLSLTKTVKATCGKAGYKRYSCSCGYYYDDPSNALNHDYELKYTKKATCLSDGYKKFECSRCGDTYKTTLYKTTTHNYQDYIVKATAKKDGYCDYKCADCGDVKYRRYTIYKPKVKMSFTKVTYDGTYKLPTVTAYNDVEGEMIQNYHYTVNMSSRKNVGRNKVTVTFNTKWYDCTITKYFTVTPKAPSSASAKLYGYDDVQFSWSKSTGADGYYVYYKKASASSYTSAGTTTKTYKKIKNLSDGVKYTFKVVPYYENSAGTKYKGLQSKTASVYTLKKVNKPTVSSSDGKAKVTWKNISGETGYQISRSTSKTGTNVVSTYKTTSGTYRKVTAYKGVGYYYKVRAYKTVTIDGKTKTVYGPWSEAKYYKR